MLSQPKVKISNVFLRELALFSRISASMKFNVLSIFSPSVIDNNANRTKQIVMFSSKKPSKFMLSNLSLKKKYRQNKTLEIHEAQRTSHTGDVM